MKKIFFTILFFTILALNHVEANTLGDAFGNKSPLDTVAGGAGFETNTTNANINTFVGTIITTILSLLGVFFLVLMIYGGFLWMTDRGNSDQVEKAKKLITAAIIGMIIILASYAISYFVISALSTPTLQST